MNSTVAATAGQVTDAAAEIYEEKFVPALFGQFAVPLVAEAAVGPGDSVIDVATGTGIVARAAVDKGATVVAVDINEGMGSVARRLAPTVKFITAAAEDLQFGDDQFDAAICQFGLMFFTDKVKAVAELARVTRPGGRVAISVFDTWENSPGYCDLIPLIEELVGSDAAEALKAPFCLGDVAVLRELLRDGGLHNARIIDFAGVVRQPSLDDWLDTEIGGWTLASMVDTRQLRALKTAARKHLAKWVTKKGSVEFPAPAYFAVAQL